MSPGCMFHKALEEEHVPEIDSLLNFALVSRRDGCTEALSKVCENTTKGSTHLCNFTWKLQFHHGINHSHNRCLEQSQQEKKADGEAGNWHQASKAQPKACWNKSSIAKDSRALNVLRMCLWLPIQNPDFGKGKKGEILPIQNLDCRIEPRWRWHWCCFCCCADALCPPEDWPFLESKKIEDQ